MISEINPKIIISYKILKVNGSIYNYRVFSKKKKTKTKKDFYQSEDKMCYFYLLRLPTVM